MSVLDGMQAQYEHSPPTSSRSTMATVRPASAHRPAAASPAGPAPITITSKSSRMVGRSFSVPTARHRGHQRPVSEPGDSLHLTSRDLTGGGVERHIELMRRLRHMTDNSDTDHP